MRNLFLGMNVTSYELKVVPFDSLRWEGQEYSKVHDLKQGEIIGFTLGIADVQWGRGIEIAYRLKWKGFWDASELPDLLLSPVDQGAFGVEPSVEGTTWGRIKASFR